MRHPRRVAAAIAGTLTLAAALAACETNGTPMTPPSTTSTTTPAATSSPPRSLTPEQQAYADAEKTYRAWVANYADAYTTFDAAKLNASLITPQIMGETTTSFAQMRAQEPGTTGKFIHDIKSIVGTRYLPDQEVQLQVCAVTDTRFYKDGVDITTTSPGGPHAPLNTTPRANQIQLTSPDKETWRVSYFVLDGGMGASC
ncbi:MAG: hypothetical protein WCG47_23765 [Dermatophilaceae bacterium]